MHRPFLKLFDVPVEKKMETYLLPEAVRLFCVYFFTAVKMLHVRRSIIYSPPKKNFRKKSLLPSQSFYLFSSPKKYIISLPHFHLRSFFTALMRRRGPKRGAGGQLAQNEEDECGLSFQRGSWYGIRLFL